MGSQAKDEQQVHNPLSSQNKYSGTQAACLGLVVACGVWGSSLVSCVSSVPLFDQDKDGYQAYHDCDDQDAAIGPRYRDLDLDGVGAGPWDAGCGEGSSEGYSVKGNDCNDQDAGVSPEVLETCDQRDNDCDGVIDNDLVEPIPAEIACDDIDNNCNGMADEYPDADGDGFPLCSDALGAVLDCDDSDEDINADALETLGDLVDTNCNDQVDVIVTTYGNGMCCFSGDNEPAEHTIIGNPGQMIYDGKGNLIFADPGSHRIRQISSAGLISTLAGNGRSGFEGDNGPAGQASLNSPTGIAVDKQGNLFIADTYNHAIRQVGQDGRILTVLGKPPQSGSTIEITDPLETLLNQPTGVLLDSDGNLLVADKLNHRILQLKTNATVIRIIGTGTAGSGGDGSAAAEAQLNGPVSMLYYGNKELLIADSLNHSIRRVDNLGVISTFAGVKVQGYSGDGGPRTSAQLNEPASMVLDDRGQLFIADKGNHRIRLVLADGTISTIAGSGAPGFAGDGGMGREAMLNAPFGVAIDPDGFLLIGDTLNHRMRTVSW